ncbi:DeoR/GlpR family DNA-binding transcription regulator [Robbsia sp. KACC 23696]|uniref:DeoR/GlpR family DNA-binding transcription regulator n=1 Tax=Robbsia sp. KACC 23696 TaxID=3149231 RepID=UPI00325A947B
MSTEGNSPSGLASQSSFTLHPRQQALLELLKRDGFVTVDELARVLGVTHQTIRRDVNQLATQNLLRRHHGGASLPTSAENVAYTARQQMFRDEKRRIAQLVATHIPHQASLFVNLGTTTEEVAHALARHEGLRVVTNNPHVASAMCDYRDCEVMIAGGTVRPWDRGIVGEMTADFFKQFKVDFAVIGVSGIEADGTLRDFDTREVRVTATIIENARQVFLVADRSKFGRSALMRVADMSRIDAFFTDQAPPAAMRDIFDAAGTQVFVAS